MEPKARAYMMPASWVRAFDYGEDAFLKFAALYYDEIVVPRPYFLSRKGVESLITQVFLRETHPGRYRRAVKSLFSEAKRSQPPRRKAWRHESHAELFGSYLSNNQRGAAKDIAKTFVAGPPIDPSMMSLPKEKIWRIASKEYHKYLSREFPSASADELLHELAWGGMGVAQGIETGLEVCAKRGTAFLTNFDFEMRAIRQTISRAARDFSHFERYERLFRTILATELPNAGELTWNDISGLRQLSSAIAFRAKVGELTDSVFSDPARIRRKEVEAFVRDEVAADLRRNAPNVPLVAVKGHASKLMPPLDVVFAIHDVLRAHALRGGHGWLIFLAEVRGYSKARSIYTGGSGDAEWP